MQSSNMAVGPSHMPLHLLESMTDNFSEKRLLGSGAYGKVYRGEQEDGQKIAIKILHDKLGHDDVQFEKEFYNLANLQHQNIVRLVGFCHETRRELWQHNETRVLAEVTKKALCFEFMENGSLKRYLFDESNGHDWGMRYTIIKGICNGLKYLHEELKPRMLHLDLKPANILLDENMNPKIADFGLSRFFKEENSHITKSPIGTFGYLPPEFINEKLISKKLDIFSLGVVIIKIMAGPEGHTKSAEMTSEKFIVNVHGNWRNRLQSGASRDLFELYSEQVKRCIVVALSCVEDDRQKRPTIGDIVSMLTETETLIDKMSTCMVKDTGLIYVHPLHLHFSFRPNKFIPCPFHVTNNMDDQGVYVTCVPKHEEATLLLVSRNTYLDEYVTCGPKHKVPPRSTHTFVVTMKQAQQPPAHMDVLDIVVETVHRGVFSVHVPRVVNLKAVFATTCEKKKTTSEVIFLYDRHDILKSMDVHPTEPWILVAYRRRLVIWNYKTQTTMMEREFSPGLAHILRMQCMDGGPSCCPRIDLSLVGLHTARFIMQSTNQLFVVGDLDGYIHVYECMAMKRVKEFKAHGGVVTSFAVHPSQPFVLSASEDQLINLWNWDKGWECIRTFAGHSSGVNQVKFNPHDVNTFASASWDDTVKIWRIFSPIHVTSLDCEEGPRCVDYYPTGGDQQHYMVTGSYGRTAQIWDLRTETCIREIKGLQVPCTVGVIDCHPDRPAVLVTASERNGVSLHDSTTYRCERTVHFGLDRVVCFAYIKGIRSLAIAHYFGIAIVGIDELSKDVLPPTR